MRKIILVLMLGGALFGCAFLKTIPDDMSACNEDPACLAKAKQYAAVGTTIASSFSPVAGLGAGAVLLSLGLWLGGRKKRD